MAGFHETEQWKRGDAGQRAVARWLSRRGFWVVPSYDYNGGPDGDKAPRMFGPGRSLILPDLDVSRDGKRFWVEVKTKQYSTFHRNSGRFEHGFAYRHYEQYLNVHEITGCKVFVIFYEVQTGHMLGQWLSKLAQHKRVSLSKQMGEMVFFPVDVLNLIGEGIKVSS